ncbi:MAG: recN [Acidimicrobiaceae bacterium]|nr:MAG: recN [Acidimicrobiaceae bacterium]
MLTELHIEDLGVIALLDLVVQSGYTAFTGETGAGKTMLVDAISLIVGGRADAAMVRAGATEARVEGRFVDGDEEVVLARVIPTEGRSRAYVNGRLATVATLAEHGARLVDIHGQHAHQGLLGVAAQRLALDRFAGIDLDPLRKARARLTEIDAALATLGGDARTRAREIDLLEFQCGELEGATLQGPDEDQQLAALEDLLAGAQAHREAGARASASLNDDDGALDIVNVALFALAPRAPFADLVERLRVLVAELGDLAAEVRDRAEAIDDDPDRLAEITERRNLLHNLRRKYGDTLADVLTFHAQAEERLAELRGHELVVERLERDRKVAVHHERAAAAEIGRSRRAAAGTLAGRVQSVLRTLAMPHAEVEVSVGDADPGDDVVFLLSANPGSPPLPLTKVASGGELARTMLALRLVLSEAPSTLVFDEVDAGIGGAVATAVGRALASLADDHQVVVVTHLAQVAALADHQVQVAKQVAAGTTTATARPLSAGERTLEIARMLSGSPDSEVAREHAAELLGSVSSADRRGGR